MGPAYCAPWGHDCVRPHTWETQGERTWGTQGQHTRDTRGQHTWKTHGNADDPRARVPAVRRGAGRTYRRAHGSGDCLGLGRPHVSRAGPAPHELWWRTASPQPPHASGIHSFTRSPPFLCAPHLKKPLPLPQPLFRGEPAPPPAAPVRRRVRAGQAAVVQAVPEGGGGPARRYSAPRRSPRSSALAMRSATSSAYTASPRSNGPRVPLRRKVTTPRVRPRLRSAVHRACTVSAGH